MEVAFEWAADPWKKVTVIFDPYARIPVLVSDLKLLFRPLPNSRCFTPSYIDLNDLNGAQRLNDLNGREASIRLGSADEDCGRNPESFSQTADLANVEFARAGENL